MFMFLKSKRPSSKDAEAKNGCAKGDQKVLRSSTRVVCAGGGELSSSLVALGSRLNLRFVGSMLTASLAKDLLPKCEHKCASFPEKLLTCCGDCGSHAVSLRVL